MQRFLNLFISTDALHVSGGSSVHHQEHITVHTASGIVKPILLLAAIVEVTREQDSSWSCSQAVYKPVWHIPLLCVQWKNSWWWTDELSETWEFHSKNRFEKNSASSWFYCKKFNTIHGHM